MGDGPTEKQFFQFIYDRQLIWYKRFVLDQKAPWTNDFVLQNYKIINMYRELDKSTLYLFDTLKDVNDSQTLLLSCTFFRFFNWPGIFEALGVKPFRNITEENYQQLLKAFLKVRKGRGTLFNPAYLISSGGKGEKHINILQVLRKLSSHLDQIVNKMRNAKTPQESFEELVKIPMVGPFLACEIWTDLTYFSFFPQGWTDNDFVNIGPGAEWGLRLLYGKLSPQELKKKLHYLHQCQQEILPQIVTPLSWVEIAYKDAQSNIPFLSLTNVEGALCEFRKYWRLSQGKGRRRKFSPDTEFHSNRVS